MPKPHKSTKFPALEEDASPALPTKTMQMLVSHIVALLDAPGVTQDQAIGVLALAWQEIKQSEWEGRKTTH